jgi:hypothetical protein
MDMNWDKINRIAENNQNTAMAGEKKFERSIFAKFPAGMHKLRIIPVGNKLEGLPFVEIGQHSFRLPDDKGQLRTQFVMCWQFLMNNLNSFETIEEKRSKSLLSYLVTKQADGTQKLDPANQSLYEQHGCPVCQAFLSMERYGVDKNVRNGFFVKQQWIWNVLWKWNGFSGDNKIYVWGVSKKHFNHIINVITQDKKAGIFTLDPTNGFDHSWNAVGGNDFSRRYDAPMFDRVPSPLHLTPDQIPFDLVEVASNSFKPYQDVVNLLKRTASELLQSIGHTIQGDQALSVPMTYQNPSAMAVPPTPQVANLIAQREQLSQAAPINIPSAVQAPNVVQFPQPAAQVFPSHSGGGAVLSGVAQFPPSNQPWAMPGTPGNPLPAQAIPVQPVQEERKHLGGGYYQVGNTVYKPDGSVAF